MLNINSKNNIYFRGQPFTPAQQNLVKLAKDAKKKEVSTDFADYLVFAAKQEGLNAREPEVHPNKKYGKYDHFHVGPVNHIFINTDY